MSDFTSFENYIEPFEAAREEALERFAATDFRAVSEDEITAVLRAMQEAREAYADAVAAFRESLPERIGEWAANGTPLGARDLEFISEWLASPIGKTPRIEDSLPAHEPLRCIVDGVIVACSEAAELLQGLSASGWLL